MEQVSAVNSAQETPPENFPGEKLTGEKLTEETLTEETLIVMPNYTDQGYTDHTKEARGTVDPHDILYGATPVFPSGQGYYIWYKESMPTEVDTSVISDEYELLYQSVKLTEYKSRLNLYVMAYSICLSVVIILMLISPFLSAPIESLSNREVIAKQNNATVFEKAENKLADEIVLGGITKNSVGFTDLVHNVIYIPLADGKFTIQESSWSSEEKAKERVNKLNAMGVRSPAGEKITAQLIKADLGSKGIWYRAMIGEFDTIEAAKQTAGELKSPGYSNPPVKNKILSQVSVQNPLM